jgi:4-alpha-glucanotransferase
MIPPEAASSGVFPRESGILLHPTSLPGRFGIGDLGDEAYHFVDFLAAAGQHLWQMLPLGPVGYRSSPYQSVSAFAGNPLLIAPSRLFDQGLLDKSDLETVPNFPEDHVDFDAVAAFKGILLERSFEVFEGARGQRLRQAFEAFCTQHASWLDDFSLFMAVKEAHGFTAWNTWEEDIRNRGRQAMERWSRTLARDIRRHKYEQFVLFEQWSELKRRCAEKRVRLVGDIPIFVALDSDSVWAHPEMFWLEQSGRPIVVAGVPPDYFSKTGQLWDNPLYHWDVMARDGYRWWMDRFRATLEFVDVVRIDHFRGFEKYWEIPAGSLTAVDGRWVDGPGEAFFDTLSAALGNVPIIAEDLGIITPEVIALREKFGFPGMRVLQFAFISGQADDIHLPHNYPRNCVAYTGTHDNETVVGWFSGEDRKATTISGAAQEKERRRALAYTGTDGSEINWDLIRLASMSVANTVIFPLQDVLGLGNEARMNTPATVSGNWTWRLRSDMLAEAPRDRLAELTAVYGR